jgi:outer membrane protein assembly factor BamB
MNAYISQLIIWICLVQFSYGQTPIIKWSYDVSDMSFGMAAIEDVDGDELYEIIFSTYRNDERIIVLNAEDGSLLWDYHTGGCNDVAPLIFDVDRDGELEIILPGSCIPRTFCFDAASGEVEWTAKTRGSDSPPTVADLDNDGKWEILHGEFGGYVICLNGEDGSELWEHLVDGNSWIQTAPTILDIDGDEFLDFVVGNWNFGSEHRIFAYRGIDHQLLWVSDEPEGVIYHGASHADIDNDGIEELVIGDYSGKLMVLNAEDGSLKWDFRFPLSNAVAAPTNIADINNDGYFEIICQDWFQLGLLDHQGSLIWQFNIPNNAASFRGSALSDLDGDHQTDLVFGTSDGKIHAVDGYQGNLLWTVDLRSDYGQAVFEIDHAPVIADFDEDGLMDIFVVGGHAEYPDVENNYGRAYAVSTGSPGGPEWKMFRRDERRTSCVCDEDVNSLRIDSNEELPNLYFNPISNQFLLDEPAPAGQMIQLYIYDVWGRLIINSKIEFRIENEINIKGAYFYRIVNEKGNERTGKIII